MQRVGYAMDMPAPDSPPGGEVKQCLSRSSEHLSGDAELGDSAILRRAGRHPAEGLTSLAGQHHEALQQRRGPLRRPHLRHRSHRQPRIRAGGAAASECLQVSYPPMSCSTMYHGIVPEENNSLAYTQCELPQGRSHWKAVDIVMEMGPCSIRVGAGLNRFRCGGSGSNVCN